MKTTMLFSTAILFTVFQFSCNSPSETTSQASPELRMERPMSEIDENKVEETDAVDYMEQKDIWIVIGSYEGLLPCTDCEGIALHLQLDEDMTFHLSQKYVGSDKRSEPRSGKYAFADNIVTLIGVADEPNKYLLENKNLLQLDWNGNKRTGANAQRYMLQRH
jgi:uncharacterized lipoprotein NlpE involved in copper resistance